MAGELGLLLGSFGESKAVQLRVDLNRLHAAIIPSRVDAGYGSPRRVACAAPKTEGENEPSSTGSTLNIRNEIRRRARLPSFYQSRRTERKRPGHAVR